MPKVKCAPKTNTRQSQQSIPHIRRLAPSMLIGYSASSLLVLLMLALFLPICTTTSSAKDSSIATATTRAVVNAAASISLALDAEVDINITPTGNDGTFSSSSTTVTVATNNPDGYSLYLNTIDDTNAMTSTSPSQNSATISALSSPTTATGFLPNTWGYSLSQDTVADPTYSAVPLTSTAIQKTNSSATKDTYALSFGAKIDTSLPAGQYSNSVMLSAVANPIVISNLQNLVYMQDMTSNICQDTKAANGANTVTPGNEVEKRLIDVRDGKEYWVAKLADGNCWMTQNLALDLEPGKKLTSGDTDLNSKETWTVLTSAELVDTVKVSDSVNYAWPTEDTVTGFPVSSEYYSTRSWSLGNEYVMVDPEGKFSCSTGEGFSCKRFSKKSSLSSYDEHFVVGSFYQYNTAAAGSAGAKVFSEDLNDVDWLKDVEDSICPRGWTLPASGRNNIINEGWPYDRAKSFYRLFYAYGYPKTGKAVIGSTDAETELLAQTNWIIYKYGAFTQIKNTDINGASQNPNKLPMSFVDGGHFDPSANNVVNAGIYGQYWSSTLAGSGAAFDYVNSKGSIRPANVDGRYLGFAVRCLAR